MTLLRLLPTLLVLALVPATANASFPGPNGKIVFEAPGELHAMSPDGSGRGALRTDLGSSPIDPAVSADGRWVAYAQGRNIWVAAADGSGAPIQVTREGANDTMPAFSPDGRRIAFVRGGDDIHVVNTDGTGLVNISNDPARIDDRPEWSPDGSRIAFSGDPCFTGGPGAPQGGPCVFVMNADGSNKVNLTPEEKRAECDDGTQAEGYSHAHHSTDPTWSPDGTRIAFAGYGDICKFNSDLAGEIWLMGADGSGKVNLTSDQGTTDVQPAFSPDGQSIAFVRSSSSTQGIFVIPVGGGAASQISTQGADPNWGRVPPPFAGPIRGTEGNDLLNGTTGDDTILGLGGDDILNGLQGNDSLDGGPGADKLTGSEGNDQIIGGIGNDQLNGASGTDRLNGGGGRDKLSGGAGNDNLAGGIGNDTIDGGQGTNRYSGGAGNDSLNSANGKRETVDCGSGRDSARVDRRDRVRRCERVRRTR